MISSFDVWNVFVGPGSLYHHNETNASTIDVFTKNCVLDYDTVACLRGTLFCFLSTVTGLLCAGRVINLHLNKHPNYYQYIVFYLALVQCFLGTAEWVVGWRLHIALAIVYLHILQVLIVTYFYLKLAFRLKFHIYNWIFSYSTNALSTLMLGYFTSFLIIGYWFASVTWTDCYANYWLFLSVGQLIIIQCMLIGCLLIVSKVNSISALESLKRSQKRGLWILLAAFELSGVINVAYHLALFLLANEEIGCSGVFLHKQLLYTPVRIVFKVSVELLPVWAMLYVFKPILKSTMIDRQCSTVSTTNSSVMNSKTEGLLLDPSFVPNSAVSRWRKRQRNLYYNSGRTLLPGDIPYRRVFRIPRRNKNLRQTASLPASLRKLRSPPLATIPEEPGSSSTSLASSAQEYSAVNALSSEPLIPPVQGNLVDVRVSIDGTRSM